MAVGIGLVFGVLRLVNFAYGQLVMAGAYALAFALAVGLAACGSAIVLCFAVVLALSLAMDRLVFRPLRTQSPAVMLVATFAIAFLLQSIALLGSDRSESRRRRSRYLNRPVTVGSVDIRKITIVAIVVAAVCLLAARAAARADDRRAAHAGRRDGLPDRAAPRRAREPCDRLGGSRLGAARRGRSVMLTVQNPLVTPDFALRDTIIVLAGVVVGGHEPALSRRHSAASRSGSPAASSVARCPPIRASTCRRSSSGW